MCRLITDTETNTLDLKLLSSLFTVQPGEHTQTNRQTNKQTNWSFQVHYVPALQSIIVPRRNKVAEGDIALPFIHPSHVWHMQYLQLWNTPSPSNPYLLCSGNHWRSFKREFTQTFLQILLQKNTSKPIYLCTNVNGRFLPQKYNRIWVLGTNLHSILISISDLKDLQWRGHFLWFAWRWFLDLIWSVWSLQHSTSSS